MLCWFSGRLLTSTGYFKYKQHVLDALMRLRGLNGCTFNEGLFGTPDVAALHVTVCHFTSEVRQCRLRSGLVEDFKPPQTDRETCSLMTCALPPPPSPMNGRLSPWTPERHFTLCSVFVLPRHNPRLFSSSLRVSSLFFYRLLPQCHYYPSV